MVSRILHVHDVMFCLKISESIVVLLCNSALFMFPALIEAVGLDKLNFIITDYMFQNLNGGVN